MGGGLNVQGTSVEARNVETITPLERVKENKIDGEKNQALMVAKTDKRV